MKRFLPLLFLLLALPAFSQTTYTLPAFSQTTYTLPTTTVDYIPFLPLLFLLLALPALSQTTDTLPTTTVDYIPYSTYANLFANDIPVTIDGAPYYVNFTAHTDSTGKCISSCYVTFQNLNTYEEIPVPYSGSFSGIAFGQPTTLSGTFSGAFNGSFVLNIVPFRACGRYGCRINYRQQGSTLTLN